LFQGVQKAETAGTPAAPTEVSIEARPNPFNPTTTIAFGVPSQAVVKLNIYSVSGRAIRSLVNEDLAAGRYSREWDGRDEAGRPVSGGVYIAKLQVDDTVMPRRLILVR
jgi:flagellar hook assembly protein FlgD